MTPDEVDAFLASQNKTLPAQPAWRDDYPRAGERRCYLPVAVNGRIAGPHVEVTVYLNNPEFLVINLLVPSCVMRLCMAGTHRDRARRTMIGAPHIHRWERNRPKGMRLPKELLHAEYIPSVPRDRSAAFAWFLGEAHIDLPSRPMEWPERSELF